MPFSFIEIEEAKSRVIGFAFAFIAVIYFLTAYLLVLVIGNCLYFYGLEGERFGIFFPSLTHVLYAALAAFLAAFIHWYFSTNNLLQKLSLAVGADPVDSKDTYHQYFKNIVDEVSVAIGGRKIEPMVIRSSGMNAFALADFEGRAVIGVTEGLLARLNRQQIEAVVGHEAGHIASGDCLNTTVLCSLSEIYEESLSGINSGMKHSRGRGSVVLLLILVVLSVMQFLSKLLRCFLSREKELRADAVSVRLTRDPLSLAEALKLISGSWRGEGTKGESIESIFIMNPQSNELDEQEGALPDLFSTHPPVKKRVAMLLSMAHLDEKALDEKLKNFRRVSPVAKPEFRTDVTYSERKWLVFKDTKWEGPFSIDELRTLSWLMPASWVRVEGEYQVQLACDDPVLNSMFIKLGERTEGLICPHCKASLQEVSYEGAPVLKCGYCQGVFVGYDKVNRILIREDYIPSEEVIRLTKIITEAKTDFFPKSPDKNSAWVLDCPKCKRKMRRQFFVYSYPVEVDRCITCSGIWFDKFELEILQYIYQDKKDILYNEGVQEKENL
jgi:heat shock protein HtpX